MFTPHNDDSGHNNRYHSAWYLKLPILRLQDPNSVLRLKYIALVVFIRMSSDQSKKQTDEELSRIDAMIAQHSEVFDGPELKFSASKQVRYGGDGSSSTLPSGKYLCHRCGDPGHFVKDCPVDEATIRQKKARQARGVPKAFLESISQDQAAKLGVGALVSSTGDLVVMKTAGKEERLRLVGPSMDIGMQRFFGKAWENCKRSAFMCFICHDIVKDPVVTNCCGELFCRQCILRHLDKTFTTVDSSISARECPNCDKVGVMPNDLIVDKSFVSMLSDITGTVAVATSNRGPGTMVRGSNDAKRQKTNQTTSGGGKMKLDLEMDSDLIGGSVSAEQARSSDTRNTVRIRNDSVLVPGGKANPFFAEGGRVLNEEEFETWKKLYKDALVRSGIGPLLTRRYPGISL